MKTPYDWRADVLAEIEPKDYIKTDLSYLREVYTEPPITATGCLFAFLGAAVILGLLTWIVYWLFMAVQ